VRRGFSLAELTVALVVLGVVLALIVRSAVFHERFQRQMAAARTGTRAGQQAVAIVAAALSPLGVRDLSPTGVADSAVEFMALVGSGAGCLTGQLLRIGLSAGSVDPPTAMPGTPRPGDSVLVFDESRPPARWIAAALVGVDTGGMPCPMLAGADLETLRLDSPLDVGPIAAFRIVRRTRFSLYRSGDGAWYLGMRDWNAPAARFNSVQPVAGPLAPYSRDPASAGLHIGFVDSAGRELPLPMALTTGARVLRISARAVGGADSAYRVIGIGREP
jgi:prepilin-type N-terminal cleavage/methylation domain-containing protein